MVNVFYKLRCKEQQSSKIKKKEIIIIMGF